MKEEIWITAHELLIKFLKYVVFEKTKTPHLRVHVEDLEKIIEHMKKNDRDMNKIDAPKIFVEIVRIVIGWNPHIEDQLYLFWDAYTEITKVSNQTKIPFNITELFSKMVSKIMQSQLIYEDIFLESKRIKTEKLSLYSRFYFFILNNETLGNVLMKQFCDLLIKFKLENKYDLETMFSVNRKIPRGEKFDTDIIVIRNALAHLNYTIEESKDSWLIKFSMNEYGYNFNKIYSKREFFEFLENAHYLYESQLALLWCIIALTQTQKFFGEQFPKRIDSF